MTAASKDMAPIQKIGLVSFKFSNIGIFSWNRPISKIRGILEKYGFKTYLYIKVFGGDELWAITSFEGTGKTEILETEPIVAYAASLENSLPLELVTVDKIVREHSKYADLVLMGIPHARAKRVKGDLEKEIEKYTEGLTTTLLVLANDKIDFRIN